MNQVGNNIMVDFTLYWRFIGKLIYLAWETQADIAFVVEQLSQYNFDPYIEHIYVAKQVI